ncbi:MAG: fructosamine kinase family protein [Gammaproteobacteria bacterium]|nr:fructosamine kinase family protein [Gammaproteobacteria bacterium]
MTTALWQAIEADVAAHSARPFTITERRQVGGGCINTAFRIGGGAGDLFVKLNDAGGLDMFEAEAAGLAEMAAADAVRVPRPVCTGSAAGQAYLVMEYLPLGGAASAAAMAALGEGLAGLHRRTAGQFGWSRDNTIGSTPQINAWCDEWVAFWRRQRLGYQLRLAADRGHGGGLQRVGERLMARLDALFADYRPLPSLLHGDLWSGNFGVTDGGEPVIFDPAVYYGDREADVAMTELFGRFPQSFYRAYDEAWPLDPGYPLRRDLYNAYHMLNHLNLFGGGYGRQAEQMMAGVVAQLG